MSGAREEVLARVRAALGERKIDAPPDTFRTAERGFDDSTFVERIGAAGAQVIEASGEGAVPAALEKLLSRLGADRVAVSGDSLAKHALESLSTLVSGETREELFECDAGVTGAQMAIAETGTLVLLSDVDRHRLTSLVPEVHIALVARDTVVPTLDDALGRVAARDGGPPRCVTFISGPSRTADIELELVVGVHGPRELHVILY